MPELPKLSVIDYEGLSIRLNSAHLSGCQIEIREGKTILHLTALGFWLLFTSILQEVQGEDINSHLPSHGLDRDELDLDMIETIIVNMSRIMNEMSDCAGWNGRIDEIIKRRLATTRGLGSNLTSD
jgi:hypothetical protein